MARAVMSENMLTSLMIILSFETTGDLLQAAVGLPIPGPVLGMALLLLALIARGRLNAELERSSTTLLSYLPMLFVPAGVGVMAHFDLIRAEWPAISLAIVLSSALTIAVTATTMRGIEWLQQAYREWRERRRAENILEAAE